MEPALRIAGAVILAWAALAKLLRPSESTLAMASFGFSTPASRRAAWAFAVAAELLLAVGVAAGSDRAAYLAAALMALFGLTLVAALMRGMAGAPCPCFGGGSAIGWTAVIRNLVLAVGFALLPSL
jgi:Methylamine utilisation protein MauE